MNENMNTIIQELLDCSETKIRALHDGKIVTVANKNAFILTDRLNIIRDKGALLVCSKELRKEVTGILKDYCDYSNRWLNNTLRISMATQDELTTKNLHGGLLDLIIHISDGMDVETTELLLSRLNKQGKLLTIYNV